MGPEAKELIEQHKLAVEALSRLKGSNPDLTNKEARAIVDAMVQTNRTEDNFFSVENIGSTTLNNFIDAVNSASTGKDGGFDSSKFNSLPDGIQNTYEEAVTQKEDEQQTYGGYTGPTAGNLGSLSPNNDDEDNNDNNNSGFSGDTDTGFGMSDEDAIYKGSLITKRKASGKVKPKHMKRGGLASKK